MHTNFKIMLLKKNEISVVKAITPSIQNIQFPLTQKHVLLVIMPRSWCVNKVPIRYESVVHVLRN